MLRHVLLILGLLIAPLPAADADRTVIAFGSCNQRKLAQPLWSVIATQEPDCFVWAGDIVYNDTTDPSRMARNYQEQFQHADYAAFRQEFRILGTWDDHDYGANNAGKDFPAKVAAQRALLDFLEEPAASARRQQAGVYASYDIGAPGRLVRLILLDLRYHRDDPGPDADPLGAAQWAWLADRLRASPAQVHCIVSSIQVLIDDSPYECWRQFPAARRRLIELIADSQAPGVVFCSGDRHIAELHRRSDTAVDYPLYDLTSSSMTHPWRNAPLAPSPGRIGPLIRRRNYGLVTVDWQAGRLRLAIGLRDGSFPIDVQVALHDLRPEQAP